MELTVRNWGKTKFDETVKLHTLKNDFLEVEILNYGGIIRKISFPDKNGKIENIVLNLSNISDYEERSPYFGAIVGRNAGRISNAELKIGETLYKLNVNNGKNNIHGGINNFSHKIWNYREIKGDDFIGLELTLKSPHLEEGFPGNISVTVKYILKNDELSLEYYGTADRETYINLTNHSYFNLSGDFKRTISDEYLKLNSSAFIAVDEATLPVKISEVNDTSFDFREFSLLKTSLDSDDSQIRIVNNGLDHPFILDKNKDVPAAQLKDDISGRMMKVFTDQPAVVVYTGNYLHEIGKLSDSSDCKKHMGICFETQDYPNVLRFLPEKGKIYSPSNPYSQKTIFKFLINKN